MFNEKGYKDYSKQIQLTLKRNHEGILSPWQISNLIVKLSSHYYKNELLNTIALAINNGIDPRNIFIMDDSFQVNNSYTYVDVFNLNKIEDVKNLYHLGFPTTLFPNEELLKVKLCFKLFSDYFTLLNSKGLERPEKNKLRDIIDLALENEDIDYALSSIKEIAINIVKLPRYEEINKKEILSKIDDLHQKRIKSFRQYKKDEAAIELLNQVLGSGSLDVKLLQNKNKSIVTIEREYYKKFFNILSELKRPIVGIYYPESKDVQIICNNFINKNARDSKFIDLKEIRHNSPYLLIVLIGIGIGAPLLKAFKSIKDDRTLAINEQRLAEEDEKTQEELEEIYNILEKVNLEPENQAINEIKNQYLKDKLHDIQESNNYKFNEPIALYGFNNTQIEINVVQQNIVNINDNSNNKN